MQNLTPKSKTQLLTACQDLAIGLGKLPEVEVTHNTVLKTNADIMALLNSSDALDEGRLTLSAKRATVRSVGSTTRDFVMATRDTFKTRLGKSYSEAWTGTGFVNSIAVPEKPEELQPLVQAVQRYLAA